MIDWYKSGCCTVKYLWVLRKKQGQTQWDRICRIGNNLNDLWQFLKIYLVYWKKLTYHAKLFASGQILSASNGQMLIKNLTLWSHCVTSIVVQSCCCCCLNGREEKSVLVKEAGTRFFVESKWQHLSCIMKQLSPSPSRYITLALSLSLSLSLRSKK